VQGKTKQFGIVLTLSMILGLAAVGCGSSHHGSGGGGSPAPSPSPSGPSISTTILPAASVNQSYSQAISATGGTPPYTFSLASGSALPSGMILSPDGTVSGTPTTTGSFPFTAQVRDAAGNTGQGQVTFVVKSPVSITTASLPAGTTGQSYNATLQASGGTAPLVWTLGSSPGSNQLPPGLSLSSQGVISGNPTSIGNYQTQFIVTSADGSNATNTYTITIN
jgi:hypothetical protein